VFEHMRDRARERHSAATMEALQAVLREGFEQMAERDRRADERDREADERERLNFKVAVIGVCVGAVGSIAAVIAIFAG
jgi:hypothetical protein